MTLSKADQEQLHPSEMDPQYYGFSFYVDKERMMTYWHQVDEVLGQRPEQILEIGVGNQIVSNVLRGYGVGSTKVDINPGLKPDIVSPIGELDEHVEEGAFPFVLCARVLQHLPFSEFESSVQQLHRATSDAVLLTLPVECLQLYLRFRITGRRAKTVSLGLPLFLKKAVGSQFGRQGDQPQNYWKVNQSAETRWAAIEAILEQGFEVEKAYRVPEDVSHAFFLLKKR